MEFKEEAGEQFVEDNKESFELATDLSNKVGAECGKNFVYLLLIMEINEEGKPRPLHVGSNMRLEGCVDLMAEATANLKNDIELDKEAPKN